MPISGGQYRLQFQEYNYSGALASGVTYIPAAKTIIMMASLAHIQDLDIYDALTPVRVGGESCGVSEYGYVGCIYCDGSDVGFKNTNIAAGGLILWGVSMA